MERGLFAGPVEVDETYMDGKRRNMSNHKRKEMTGRETVGKTAVVGMKDRETLQVAGKGGRFYGQRDVTGFCYASCQARC